MRENRTSGSEGRESDLNRTPLPLSVINGRWPMLNRLQTRDIKARERGKFTCFLAHESG